MAIINEMGSINTSTTTPIYTVPANKSGTYSLHINNTSANTVTIAVLIDTIQIYTDWKISAKGTNENILEMLGVGLKAGQVVKITTISTDAITYLFHGTEA